MLDIVVSVIALVVLLPVFIVVPVLIKFDSRGPVLFLGTRIGRYGRPFKLLKFRTMCVNADKISHVVSTPNDDARITRIGRAIRRYNIDEFPQFINVLKGDMSIVGPRPEVPQYVAKFTEEEMAILSVRPGITDWATVWINDKGKILQGSEDPEKIYMEKIRPEKLRLQLKYIRNHSLWTDVEIILRTFKVQLDRFKSEAKTS
jgi:lipopolysaccharide/colanic/teichoic acid biosynthesis glycosyltransferase